MSLLFIIGLFSIEMYLFRKKTSIRRFFSPPSAQSYECLTLLCCDSCLSSLCDTGACLYGDSSRLYDVNFILLLPFLHPFIAPFEVSISLLCELFYIWRGSLETSNLIGRLELLPLFPPFYPVLMVIQSLLWFTLLWR